MPRATTRFCWVQTWLPPLSNSRAVIVTRARKATDPTASFHAELEGTVHYINLNLVADRDLKP